MNARWVMAAAASIFSLIGSHSTAYAQSNPAFEVSQASGRYCSPKTPSRTPQRIAFQATLVPDIMAFAYDLPLERIERRPQWMYDDCFNVAVTTAAPTSLPEQKRLLQKLLEDRFGLVAHRISYPSPVYYLVRGPKVNLTPTQEPDTVGVPDFRCRTGVPNPCVVHASMSDLALSLSGSLPVVDKTGITGMYDIEVGGGGRGIAAATIRPVASDAAKGTSSCAGRGCPAGNNPTLERLGLQLELHRDGTAESLIIDHIEQPRL